MGCSGVETHDMNRENDESNSDPTGTRANQPFFHSLTICDMLNLCSAVISDALSKDPEE